MGVIQKITNNGLSKGLKNFMIQNKILGTVAGVTVAFSFGTMIRSLVGDIVLPLFYLLLSKFGIDTFTPLPEVNLETFLKEFISWLSVLVVTFMLIDFVFKKYVLK
jgi:large-conductance mechanosensitive channel